MYKYCRIRKLGDTRKKKNCTFVNKYAWNGICKQDTFQEVSFQLKNWKVYFFFHLCVRRMYGMFSNFLVNLLIGANLCVSKHNNLVNSASAKKVILFIAFSLTFWKMKEPLSKSSHQGIFVEVRLPYFPGLHFHSNIALPKNLKLYSSSLVILISSHLSSSQFSACSNGFPDQSRRLLFFVHSPVGLRCFLEL